MKSKKIVSICNLTSYKDECHIYSNDLWFENIMTEREFLRRHKDIIKQFSDAEIVDYENLTIVTPFGTTEISRLSTGCKALLNINYLLETGDKKKTYLVNVTDIGDNVIEKVFETVAGTNINIYLRRYIWPENESLCYKINGTITKDISDFLRLFKLD